MPISYSNRSSYRNHPTAKVSALRSSLFQNEGLGSPKVFTLHQRGSGAGVRTFVTDSMTASYADGLTGSAGLHNARNSADVKLVRKVSQRRKIGTRKRRRWEGGGALYLRIASFTGNSERQSFVRCTVHAIVVHCIW
ncbi:hypothetical protein EVAR_18365_1 [Eumeta japonica]|uniref:Uncharacterized protein n=1 Tax=Eumeta variegata TaxID=151549 RepID=A0A4C1UV70_EUMVA|nr:hypothetical protein EVAR_18365_1 [Eumeta japonica]